MNYNVLMEKVIAALKNFFDKDRQLLTLDANERSISHKLAEHLQKEFTGFNVDCEYNRRGKNKKTLPRILFHDIKEDDQEAKTIFPDILIHKRSIQTNNLLVVEIKKSNSRVSEDTDITKLKAFTDPKEKYKYKVGLFIVFDVVNRKLSKVKHFENGEEFEPVINFKKQLKMKSNGS